jgi:hypothetical protein
MTGVLGLGVGRVEVAGVDAGVPDPHDYFVRGVDGADVQDLSRPISADGLFLRVPLLGTLNAQVVRFFIDDDLTGSAVVDRLGNALQLCSNVPGIQSPNEARHVFGHIIRLPEAIDPLNLFGLTNFTPSPILFDMSGTLLSPADVIDVQFDLVLGPVEFEAPEVTTVTAATMDLFTPLDLDDPIRMRVAPEGLLIFRITLTLAESALRRNLWTDSLWRLTREFSFVIIPR